MMLQPDEFAYIQNLMAENAGISLEADQDQFVVGRLQAVAARFGLKQPSLLIARMRDHNDRIVMQQVVESLVTHETSFFRDPHFYDEIAERLLPELIAGRNAERRLSIWCAACSTGQEPYSIAMILRERFAAQLDGWQVEIFASDLSAAALQQARSGAYSDVEIRRGLSEARLAVHFRKSPAGWQIDDRLRKSVQFQQVNLMGTWPAFPPIDLILLRNVLVYMTPSTRQTILTRMQRCLRANGWLMLGSSETANIPNLRIANVRRT